MNTKLLPLIFALTTGLLFTTTGGAEFTPELREQEERLRRQLDAKK